MAAPNTPLEDPKHHPEPDLRHNPAAWREYRVPPVAKRTLRSRPGFSTWPLLDHPEDALDHYVSRAAGMLEVVYFMFQQLHDGQEDVMSANPQAIPQLELHRATTRGLAALLATIGETLDLAENAANAAIQEAKTSHR